MVKKGVNCNYGCTTWRYWHVGAGTFMPLVPLAVSDVDLLRLVLGSIIDAKAAGCSIDRGTRG